MTNLRSKIIIPYFSHWNYTIFGTTERKWNIKMKRKILQGLMLILILATIVSGCTVGDSNIVEVPKIEENIGITENVESTIEEDGLYSTPEEVAEYIHLYNKLPQNFITKKEAIDLGWDSNKGNLWEVTDKMSIGGDSFGNREGLLPKAENRKYFECDVNYEGGFRGAERIVYSNDGLIFYTKDHYKTFEQLY